MPWKGETDPYRVWLSEIILQQTRVEQGLKYYQNFIANFPNIHALANATDQRIYKLWEGLGYYTRCRNLIITARHISKDLGGTFPSGFDEIKKLKGIGPYTAAAISSFAFNEPQAVVDGNVFRILSRVFGINNAIDTTEGKKFFNEFATQLLDTQQSAVYNQAIMDFGAVVCKPVPHCNECPFNARCVAFLEKRVFNLPVKSKRQTIQKRWFYYAVFEHKGKYAIRQRLVKDIWHNLFEFLLIEDSSSLTEKKILKQIHKYWLCNNGVRIEAISSVYKQQLTHQLIQGRFAKLKLAARPKLPVDVLWIKKKELKNFAFPKFINQYLLESEFKHGCSL